MDVRADLAAIVVLDSAQGIDSFGVFQHGRINEVCRSDREFVTQLPKTRDAAQVLRRVAGGAILAPPESFFFGIDGNEECCCHEVVTRWWRFAVGE